MARRRNQRDLLSLWMCATALSGLAGLTARAAQRAAPPEVTPEQVDQSIDKGKEFIYSQMKGDSWEESPARNPAGKGPDINGGQWGGQTALCAYALLAAGESPQEPRLLEAIEFLKHADIVGTYALGLRAQVWLNIPKNDQVRAAIVRDAKLLLLARRTKGVHAGLYSYVPGASGTVDNSCSQYGVLGLWACSDEVESIPETFWSESDELWRKNQGDDGSWAYNTRPGALDPKGEVAQGTASMTAAGLATLFITQDFIFRGRGLNCDGDIIDKNIQSGLHWYSEYFKSNGTSGLTFYALYGLERVGVASGYKFSEITTGFSWALRMQSRHNWRTVRFRRTSNARRCRTLASHCCFCRVAARRSS